MVSDGLFSTELLDITVELMFYNENHQTGIVQAYQFLINNSGDIEKYKDTNEFYLTRYSEFYHQSTESMRRFLILLDALYFIVLIVYIIQTILKIKERIMEYFYYKVLEIKLFDLLDVLILIFSLANLGIWMAICWSLEDVKIPFDNVSKFEMYAIQSENTKDF